MLAWQSSFWNPFLFFTSVSRNQSWQMLWILAGNLLSNIAGGARVWTPYPQIPSQMPWSFSTSLLAINKILMKPKMKLCLVGDCLLTTVYKYLNVVLDGLEGFIVAIAFCYRNGEVLKNFFYVISIRIKNNTIF